ncbi:Crp/Fnr family transcriptional regulator [Paenibacillus sp. GSMTC-2017]|uniref:Crp/Fnr family transcriptional regulator n=1 Tax=Paenibacillus sp. GSMTC-2017 TaxID=2794350 RepID=UPI0018D8EF4B|nr:Crp/Fnr family transcriptional regulator [Paenibacillus sp. GSMTC-2017]MBH5319552.1 Crp/Fnr family transcriptional regulator [Paenibacillus sp. GSMTC-2017]
MNNQLSSRLDDIVRTFPCFKNVSTSDWENRGLSIVRVPPSIAIAEGHLFEHAAFVLSGTVRIYKVGATGRELTLYRVRQGEVCVVMMASILGETPYEATAAIEEDTVLLLLPVDLFKRWMSNYPTLNQYIYKLFIKRMVGVTDLIDDIAFKPMEVRVAELVLQRLSAGCDDKLSITHEQLASELGTAREVVSRTLKELEQRGVLEIGRGSIRHIRTEELKRIVTVLK